MLLTSTVRLVLLQVENSQNWENPFGVIIYCEKFPVYPFGAVKQYYPQKKYVCGREMEVDLPLFLSSGTVNFS